MRSVLTKLGRMWRLSALVLSLVTAAPGGIAAAGSADGSVNQQPPKSFQWDAQHYPHDWHVALGTTRVTVTVPAARDAGQAAALPSVEIATPGVQGVRFQADEWGGAEYGGITFRRDPLDPAHSTLDIMATWYSGGAHCCTHVKVASLIGKSWRLTDLGEWNGDADEFPRPRKGPDGAPVLPLRDEAFNYVFAAYAFSGAPLKLLRVVDGKVVDVSGDRQYRPWMVKDMAYWRKLCTDPKEDIRNGFCAAYAASAAHAGLLRQAWPVVVRNAKDEAEAFCEKYVNGDCKDAVKFAHYADAVRWFLRQNGYPVE